MVDGGIRRRSSSILCWPLVNHSTSLPDKCFQVFLLPRIIETLKARHGLKLHQSSLFTRLTQSLNDLRSSQHKLDKVIDDENGNGVTYATLNEVPLAAEDGRPLTSYRNLIRILLSSEKGEMTFRQIVTELQTKFPYFVHGQGDWEVSGWTLGATEFLIHVFPLEFDGKRTLELRDIHQDSTSCFY